MLDDEYYGDDGHTTIQERIDVKCLEHKWAFKSEHHFDFKFSYWNILLHITTGQMVQ